MMINNNKAVHRGTAADLLITITTEMSSPGWDDGETSIHLPQAATGVFLLVSSLDAAGADL